MHGRSDVRRSDEDVSGRDDGRQRAEPRDRRRRVHGARRAVGLRQDDRAADGRRARGDLARACCGSATASSTTCRRATATSRWSSRATRSTRTSRCTRTSPSGCKLKKMPKDEIDRRVAERRATSSASSRTCKRKPRALSGGQRQRVAMGRAIVREPAAFLMDEPLSNLDAKLRVQMRAEIARLQRDLGVTTIYVTHDQVEAMTMGDRVAVMRKGELQQVADPQTLYDRPVNLFVGGFIGSPAMNMLEATLERANGDAHRGRVGDAARRSSTTRRSTRSPALEDYDGRARDPRHPARGPRGRRARARRAGRPAAARARSSCARRSARRSWCTSASSAQPAETEETKELARGRRTATDGAGRRAGATARSSSAASARARASTEGDDGRGRGRHARAALLRPGHRSRDLRRRTDERSTT